MSWDIELDDQLLQDLYAWIDQIPLSRPKKRIEKDFSDGVMVAELVKYYFPSWVDLHNYAPANSTQQKLVNWGLLNRKLFTRFGMNVPETVMRGISLGRQGLVEIFLYNLRTKIDDVLHQKAKTSEANAITPRQPQQYSTGNDFSNYNDDYSPKTNNKFSSGVVYFEPDVPKSRIPAGPLQKKSTSMHSLSADMVSRIEYDEKEQECLAKDEQIQILQAKIRRLEHLLHLKDIRVEDLAEKLDQTRGLPGANNRTHLPYNGRK